MYTLKKEIINKLDFIKSKTPALQKDTENQKTSHRLQENICKRYMTKDCFQSTQRTLKIHQPV
jgi:hypothetical protein